MLRLTELVESKQEGADARRADDKAARAQGSGAPTLTLRFEDRRRSRMRARLDDGREVALLLPHGTLLRDGQRLRDGELGDRGELVLVRAAAQTLSYVRAADPLLLARAAYHLGNRHIPVQLGAGWLAYEHDHVLDGMVRELGLAVETHIAPFEPEGGGYRHEASGRTRSAGHRHEH